MCASGNNGGLKATMGDPMLWSEHLLFALALPIDLPIRVYHYHDSLEYDDRKVTRTFLFAWRASAFGSQRRVCSRAHVSVRTPPNGHRAAASLNHP
eukprot:821500-Pyramimonas_sp.AAC.2